MTRPRSRKALLDEFERISRAFGKAARSWKLELVEALSRREPGGAPYVKRMHAIACFLRAFPDDGEVYVAAGSLLKSIAARVSSMGKRPRRLLDDTGIAGTTIHFEFSCDMASWLTRRFPESVEIDWSAYEGPERLDAVLVHLLAHAEIQLWDDGDIGTRAWVKQAVGGLATTDLTWLIDQIRRSGSRRRMWAALYDDAEVPVRWHLSDSSAASKTFNEITWLAPSGTRAAWRKPARGFRDEITRPIRGIKTLPRCRAEAVIDVARAALAVRHREVYAFTYANPEEVYLVPVGLGVHVAVFGVLPTWRLNIEGNYGYVILSCGVPVGYGGASPLFGQINTGVSMFDEYRRGESRFLFLQVLRVFHSLFGCDRVIANPYQFGAENRDAVATGAFWFYYKLGFRPVQPDVRRLARDLAEQRRDGQFSMDRATIRHLLSGDLQLTIGHPPASTVFHERWLSVLALAATKRLAEQGAIDRAAALRAVTSSVADSLGIRLSRWPANERRALQRLAPVLDLIPDLGDWPETEKRACVQLIRAKGAPRERPYVVRLARHERLRRSLAAVCRRK